MKKLIIIFMLMSAVSFAADNTWLGPVAQTSCWETATNWSLGTVPNESDTAIIDNGGIASICLCAATAEQVKVEIGGLYITNCVYMSTTNGMRVGDGGTGTVSQMGGSSLVAITNSGADLYIGNGSSGVGYYGMNGGTLIIDDSLSVCRDQTSTGYFNFTNGTIYCGRLDIAWRGSGIYNQYGGTNYVEDTVVFGRQDPSGGTLNMYGGTLVITNDIIMAFGSGTSLMHIAGGVVDIGTKLQVNRNSNGRGTLSVVGADASISIGAALDCDSGGRIDLEFEINDGGISPIVADTAQVDSTNTFITYKMDVATFTGTNGTTYELVKIPTGNILSTNGLRWFNQTGLDMTLSEFSNVGGFDGLMLTLNDDFPGDVVTTSNNNPIFVGGKVLRIR